MATKGAYKRLTKEYLSIQKNPPPYIVAKPLESNILEWHYVIRGPPGSPYEGGEYHGKLIFPADYPFKPPAIKMLTPNGRFQTDYRLCLTMSDYHPGSWNPAWSVSTILTGLLSFMLEDEPTTGSIKTSLEEKRMYAKKSHAWNLQVSKFKDVFPELCTPEPAPLRSVNPTSAATSADLVKRKAILAKSESSIDNSNRGSGTSGLISSKKATGVSSTSSSTSGAKGIGGGGAPIRRNHPHQEVARAGRIAAVNLWQNVRSNIWRVLLLAVFVYLFFLKVMSRVRSEIGGVGAA